jgi:hypothetical protein
VVSVRGELRAEWALWGKGPADTQYGVLECSAGTLNKGDFLQLIRRYAPGTPDRLPQYTVAWIPAEADDASAFIALAIHEHAPYGPARPDGRSRYDSHGREIVFVRLFCVPYDSLAEHEVSYAELLEAIDHQELPPRGADAPEPVMIRIPPRQSLRPATGPVRELAETVAGLLLTGTRICVVGAGTIPATDRLAFIDSVLSLLPYGLRATLSASTWASPTAQNLKLRLYFAEAPGEDEGRTRHVRWEQSGSAEFPDPDGEAARLYLDWLRQVGSRAQSLLTGRTGPLRFTDADIRQMVAALPRDLTVADALEDLAASLSDGVRSAVAAEVKRLRRYLADPLDPAGPLDPAEREGCRRRIADLGLLKDHPDIPSSTSASLYRTLLRLAFESPFTYVNYCEVEDAVGGPPRGVLRSVLLEGKFAAFLPWLLVARAEPEFTDEDAMKSLAGEGPEPTALFEDLQRALGKMRGDHRATAFDFGMLYLRVRARDARAELAQRGYLTDMLEVVFPSNEQAQRIRLEGMLRLVYGESISRNQIRELFADPRLRATAAFEAAVKRLAASPRVEQFIEEQASYARLRYRRDDNHSAPGRRKPSWLEFIGRLFGYPGHRPGTSDPE